MGLSLVLFITGVICLVFVINRCADPLDWIDSALNIALVVVGVLFIATALITYPSDRPFGGAPYNTTIPPTSLIPPQVITIEPANTGG